MRSVDFETRLNGFAALSHTPRLKLLRELKKTIVTNHVISASKLGLKKQQAYDQLVLLDKKYGLVTLLNVGVVAVLSRAPTLRIYDVEKGKWTNHISVKQTTRVCEALANKQRLRLYDMLVSAHQRGRELSVETLATTLSTVPSMVRRLLRRLESAGLVQIRNGKVTVKKVVHINIESVTIDSDKFASGILEIARKPP